MANKIISTKTASPLEYDRDTRKQSMLALVGTFILPAVLVFALLFLLISFRGGIEAGVANLAVLLPVGYAFAAGMVASVNPCGMLMLPSYIMYQLRTEGAKSSTARRALRSEDYVATLQATGFTDFVLEDQQDALLDMVADVRRKLLGVELAVGLGKLDLGDLDLSEGKRLARRAVELIEEGTVGYTLIAARKA